jgi:hypothetical protein
MPKQFRRFSRKRIGLYLVVLLTPVIILAYVSMTSASNQSQTATSTQAIGLPPVYPWSLGTPVTFQLAAQSTNYTLNAPSQLPSGSSLTEVRFSSDANYVFLGYTVNGVSSIGDNPGGWGLFITEQSSISNPLPPATTVNLPVIARTSYPNGTTYTSTIAQASTVTSGWQNMTVSGQSVLAVQIGNGAEIQWWSHDVWYRLYANLPLSQLQNVAASMISSPSGRAT